MIGSCYGVHRGGGGQLLIMMMIRSMTITPCLAQSMVLPYFKLIYMSTPLRLGGRRAMGHRLNNFFKASSKYGKRRRGMYVHIVWTQMRSKMKCGSATLIQTVSVLHSMCTSHMTCSEIYIIIKSCFFSSINAALFLIQS